MFYACYISFNFGPKYMDYEKKYNEALERARKIHDEIVNNEVLGFPGQITDIFPELRESEDERIRKGLIEALKTSKTVGELKFILPEPTREECIAYLEKQKETKPALSKVELLFRGEKVTVKRPFYRDDKGRGYSTTEQDEEVAWNALRAWCEKKGISLYDLYPKTEWSDEDKNMWTHLNGYLNGFSCSEDAIKQMADWFYELPNRFNLQPKQELTEEDKENIESIKIIFRKALSKGISCEEEVLDLTDWLKSLRPQPREEIYQSAKHDLAIKFMNYLDENRPEGKMSLSNGECEDIDNAFKENDWSKIIRYIEKYQPHWKPSEEQMDALKELIDDANKAGWVTPGATELYEQLKKL